MVSLIDEWKHAWKLFSVQANAIGLAIVGAYTALPEEFKSTIPVKYVAYITGVTFAAGLVGRLVKQASQGDKDDTGPTP